VYIYKSVFNNLSNIVWCQVRPPRTQDTHTHAETLSHTHAHTHAHTHTRTCAHTRAPLRCCSLSLDQNVFMEVLILTNTRTRTTSHTHTHIHTHTHTHTHRTQVCAAVWRHDVSTYTYANMCMIIAYSLLYTCICSATLSYIRVYIYMHMYLF